MAKMCIRDSYMADKYDVTAEQSIERANERVKQSTEDVFADTVTGYATVVPESTSIQPVSYTHLDVYKRQRF